ncbi:MAG: SurA N-terminal domain-containing protein [Myxococcota bacterium]
MRSLFVWALLAAAAPAGAQEPAPAPAEPASPEAPAPAPAPASEAPAPEAPPAEAPAEGEGAEPVAAEAPPPRPEPSGPRIVDRIAAVVNNDVIALSEVYEIGSDFIGSQCPAGETGADPACTAAAELQVLDALIRRTLIRQELARLELDVTAADVDQQIDRTVKQYGLADRQALKTEVEASGKRWDQYRDELMEYLRTSAFQARILAPRVTVTEDELRDLYQRTSRSVTTPAVKLSGLGIPVPPDATAEDAAKMSQQAAAVAKEINSGKLPWDEAVAKFDAGFAGTFADQVFEPSSLVEPIAAVVFAPDVEVGHVQPPIRFVTPNGQVFLVLVRVDEQTTHSEVAPYEDVKQQIQEQVFAQKLQEAEEEWYQRARREAAIDVKIDASGERPAG